MPNELIHKHVSIVLPLKEGFIDSRWCKKHMIRVHGAHIPAGTFVKQFIEGVLQEASGAAPISVTERRCFIPSRAEGDKV